MAGSARSTTTFRFKTGTGGDHVRAAGASIDRYASSRRRSLSCACNPMR
jgi:hypothetical protein